MKLAWPMPDGFSEVDLALFAGATWNPHLIHLNPEFARASGLGGVVVQSHLVPARLLALLDQDQEFVAGKELRRISWRNRAPIPVNEDLVYSVTRSGDGGLDWELRMGEISAATGRMEVD